MSRESKFQPGELVSLKHPIPGQGTTIDRMVIRAVMFDDVSPPMYLAKFLTIEGAIHQATFDEHELVEAAP